MDTQAAIDGLYRVQKGDAKGYSLPGIHFYHGLGLGSCVKEAKASL